MVFVSKSFLKDYWAKRIDEREVIEKARKGEQAANHKYITRKATGKPERPYVYFWLKDFLINPIKKITEFFGVTEKQIDDMYAKNNIKKDFDADKKTFSQHLAEYFAHRKTWDNRFADKANRQKVEKPIKMEVSNKLPEQKGMETPEAEDTQLTLIPETKEKKEWKANPSLMKRIWGMFTGKNVEKQEKLETKVEEKIENELNSRRDAESHYSVKENRVVNNKQELLDTIEKYKNSETKGGKLLYESAKQILKNKFGIDVEKESDAEEHENRSQAMLGNQNAKKDFNDLENVLTTGNSLEIDSKNAGNVILENGVLGKSGFGLKHIIEQRFIKDGKSEEEIAALIHLILESVRDGEITRENGRTLELSKNGIVAILRKEPNDKGFQWVLTGFDNAETDEVKKEATDAITTVIANNSYTPEFSSFRNQVGAVIASIRNITTESENVNTDTLKLSEAMKGNHGNKIAMLGNQNAKKYGLTKTDVVVLDYLVNQAYNNGIMNWTIFDTGMGDAIRNGNSKIQSKIIQQLKKETGEKQISLDKVHNAIKEMYNITDGGNNNAENNIRIEPGRISTGISSIRAAGEGSSSTDVSATKTADNTSKSGISADESGIRPTRAEDVSGLSGDRGRGKLTKGQAKKIREACKKLLAEKTDAEMTEEDKLLLSQYVGGGGLDEENTTNSNVLYEFYTPRNVVEKVWQLVDKYNPNQNKKVIEPSSGIGRFTEGRKEQFTLFELEEESARIAKILHPESEVVQGAFQENFMKKGRFTGKDFEKFDVAIGNPPYGKYSGKYKGMGEGKDHTRYDEYFIDRTLDTLKDGGILAFVMPSHFLESGNSKIKQKLAEKGKLLEAWRLPNGTFDSTDVGTDIVLIRKEKGNVEDFYNSNYFEKNPSHIAGEVATRIGRFGEEKYVKVKDGEDFESAVSNIDVNAVEVDKQVQQVVENVTVKETVEAENKLNVADKIKFTGETKIAKNGNTYKVCEPTDEFWAIYKDHKEDLKSLGYMLVKAGGQWKVYDYNVEGNKEVKTAKKTDAEKKANRSRAMMGNKNAEGEHEFTASIGTNMTAAEFNEKYGKNFDPKDLDIWKTVDNYGNVDETKLTEEQRKYVESSDHYVSDNGKFVNIVNYASGNIRSKLQNLNADDPQYEVKKSLLESALPAEKKIGQFTLSPIADWTEKYTTKEGINLINAFFAWAYNGNGYYSASNSPISPEEIPPEISFDDIRDYIHAIPVRAESRNGEDKMYNAKVAYRKREKRREAAERLFNRFLKEGLSLEDQKDLETAWNNNFNTYVNPDYTKIPVFVDGMNTHKGTKEFNLTSQQIKGVTQLINKGTGLLAYDVGVGKTATGIVATVNQIQTGRAKRPLICVPKAVYKNWIGTIHQLFPNVKVNELGNMSKNFVSEEFEPEDGSISVCTYEGLEKIEFNEEEEAKISEDVEFGAMRTDAGEMSKRAAASRSEKIQETVGGMLKTSKGDTVQFSKMGFDHITVDEVHNFRNLFSVPRKIYLSEEEKQDPKSEANEFKALGGGKPSNRAMKLFAITQLIQRENEGRNTFLLSATPFQNSPIEIYSILSYMARDRLKELGIYSLEQFVKQFAELKSEYVVKVNKIEEKMVMKNFNNLAALQNLINEYIDKVDGEEAGVIRPEKRTHAPELELSDLQKAIMAECNDYIEQQELLPKDDRDPGYMFRAMNAMRNCALSPALVDDDFIPDDYDKPSMSEIVDSSPKLKFVCDSVAEQYKQNSQNGQVIYMPSGVEQFPQVRDYLVKHGVPKDAIALMKGAASSDKALDERQAVMDEFNDVNGKCKVIIGSSTIKEGVSLNGNSTVIYNTQLDWNPTDAQQVEGRIWRQGNKQGITHIVYPLMHDSIDSMIYQKYDEKGSRINDLFSYKGDNLNVEDINPEELKFGLIKDPEKRADMQVRQFKEKAESDQKLYAQMIDVLHKQAHVAFGDPVKEVKDSYINDYEQRKTAEMNQSKEEMDKVKLVMKNFEKKWKGKEDSFNPQLYAPGTEGEKELEGSNITLRWETKTGKEGYERAIRSLKNSYDSAEWYYKNAKGGLDKYNKEIKAAEKKKEAVSAYLKSKGIRTEEDFNNKINEYVALMDQARNDAEKSEEMRQVFYEQAVAYNKANEKTMLSLDDMVKQNVSDIMTNLRPMDKEWRSVLEERLYEKYPHLRKSCLIKNGRVWLKKSVIETTEFKDFCKSLIK